MESDTIAAIATPTGRGGIGIIRVSGMDALAIGQHLFHPARNDSDKTLCAANSHRLIYGNIIDPQDQQVIDEALVVYMCAPHSYTCEDVIEFQTHSGPAVLNQVLALVLQSGARLAEPGEFTRRAFVNGRLDLSQAEAVADIINATSTRSLNMAAQQLGGRLKDNLQAIILDLTELLADMEAAIEFPDDVGEPFDRTYLINALQTRILPLIQSLSDSFRFGRIIKEGLRLAIVGRPNVGKSSLLNALLEKDRAIVTDIPGTTRDTVEEVFSVGGLPVLLTDTAGLHRSQDPVETVGMQKTHEVIHHADLVLFVIEATDPAREDDQIIFQQVREKPTLLVVNKMDLADHWSSIALPGSYEVLPWVKISALKGTGMNDLKNNIVSRFSDPQFESAESVTITNARHSSCLISALTQLTEASDSLEQGIPEDLVAINFHQAIAELKKITGEQVDSELLDFIFKRFCIGK